MNAKIPFLWAPNRGCKHTHIYFMNLLICLRDTELFLLYQMVIIYSPVQMHQEYPTFTYFIQEWVFYKGACKYYISRFSQILDPHPPKKMLILHLKTTQTATSPFASHKWVASDHQCVRHPCRSSHTFSRSGGVAQLIIVGWSGSEFQTGNSSIKLQKWRSEVWSWYCGEQKSSITSCNLSVPLQTSVVLNSDIHNLQCNCLLKLKRTMLKINTILNS